MAILDIKDAEYIIKYIISKRTTDILDRELIDVLSILCYEKLTKVELDIMVELYKYPVLNAKYKKLAAENLGISFRYVHQLLHRLRKKGMNIDGQLDHIFMFKPLDNKEKIKLLEDEIENKIKILKKLKDDKI